MLGAAGIRSQTGQAGGAQMPTLSDGEVRAPRCTVHEAWQAHLQEAKRPRAMVPQVKEFEEVVEGLELRRGGGEPFSLRSDSRRGG